jgi:hypothetical protein
MALNELRSMNVHNFSLVYGRFMCGFNKENIQKTKEICDYKSEQKTHVLYEYIATESGKTETLKSFIQKINNTNKEKMNVELMNIMIMLMISLQHAQDQLDFTHYDLHLENVLLVKLNGTYKFKYDYKGNEYSIILEYFPFIIDFGRSYVNASKVDKIVNETIIDTDKNKKYSNFEQYQKECWESARFVLNLDNNSDRLINKEIRRILKSKLMNEKFRKKVLKEINKDFSKNFSDIDLDIDLILDAYYIEDDSEQITNGIHPDSFHDAFDFYRLIRSMCDMIEKINPSEFWMYLDYELEAAYPFYIPYYFNLPTNYESFTGAMKKPIDIAEYLYDVTSEYTNDIKEEYKEPSYTQLGGGSKIKDIKKMNKKECEKMQSKIYKKMKTYKK